MVREEDRNWIDEDDLEGLSGRGIDWSDCRPRLDDRLLFGPDRPMFYHSWTEPRFIEPFVNKLSRDEFRKMACDNPRRFPGDRLPRRWRSNQ